jgi:hypothetical protein
MLNVVVGENRMAAEQQLLRVFVARGVADTACRGTKRFADTSDSRTGFEIPEAGRR